MLKNILAFTLFLIFLSSFPVDTLSGETRGPLSLKEIENLLDDYVSPQRIEKFILNYGINFKLTEDTKRRLEGLGASPKIIGILRSIDQNKSKGEKEAIAKKKDNRSEVSPDMAFRSPQETEGSSKRITNSIKMEFVLIPAGNFMMGSPPDEPERGGDETQHLVTISRPYYLQTTEVTQGQWKTMMEKNPSRFSNCGDDCPVENVSWNDAQEFIKKLNQKESISKYRIPTEAEWEYATRAGTKTPFHTGKCISTEQANYHGNFPSLGCSKGEFRQRTVKVKGSEPNTFGLYDMHGNVWEWCQDWYGEYPSGSVTDPTGLSSGRNRVVRGGAWNVNAKYLRTSYRFRYNPDERYFNLGFRVARDY